MFARDSVREWGLGQFDHSAAAAAGLAIGVVDDDRDVGEALVLLLEAEGMRVGYYLSAEGYLARGGTDDCVVTDLEMPGLSGLDLFRELRARGIEIPVILTPGRPSDTLIEEALAMGLFAVIPKPLVGSKIVETIRRAVPDGPDDTHPTM